MHNFLLAFCILHCVLGLACGVPNLESGECQQARVAAKQFYSFHFGNDMRPSTEGLKARERFLTPRYFAMLASALEAEMDPFTMTREYPRAFRIAECRAVSPTDLDLQVQLFWRDDESSVQQEVAANMVKQGDAWLLDGVGSKRR